MNYKIINNNHLARFSSPFKKSQKLSILLLLSSLTHLLRHARKLICRGFRGFYVVEGSVKLKAKNDADWIGAWPSIGSNFTVNLFNHTMYFLLEKVRLIITVLDVF